MVVCVSFSRPDGVEDEDDLNFDHSLLLLRKFHLAFRPHEQTVSALFLPIDVQFSRHYHVLPSSSETRC